MELDLKAVVFSINGERVTPKVKLRNGDHVDYEIMPSGYVEDDAVPPVLDAEAESEAAAAVEDTDTFKMIHEDQPTVKQAVHNPFEALTQSVDTDAAGNPTVARLR
jgi:hypothetical protein